MNLWAGAKLRSEATAATKPPELFAFRGGGVFAQYGVRLDVEYIDRWSLIGDLKILIRTIPAVLCGTGS